MSLSNTLTRQQYSGNGSNRDFAIVFDYFDLDQIVVNLVEVATDIVTPLVLTTDYTLINSPPTIVRTVATYSADYQIVVRRNTVKTQIVDYITNGSFLAGDHEKGLDRIVMMVQEEATAVEAEDSAVAAGAAASVASASASAASVSASAASVSAASAAVRSISSIGLYNVGLITTIGSNALTIWLTDRNNSTPGAGDNACRIGFRSATLTNGSFSEVSVTSQKTIVISSGSTLGQTSVQPANIYVYVINNAGDVELAVSGTLYPEVGVISTTAEGGAGAADSNTVMYSTTARTNVAYRLIGVIANTQTTAGTWASAGTVVAVGAYGTLKTKNVPTLQQFTTGSGTYITPPGTAYLRIRMVGGGGSGGAGGTAATSAGNAGGASTFGTAFLTANGGAAGQGGAGGYKLGAAGGTTTINSGAIGFGITGESGGGNVGNAATATVITGGKGGATPLGGSGMGGVGNLTAVAASTGTGSGSGGGGSLTTASGFSGAGGGAGGYIDVIVPNPLSSYAYACGTGGGGVAAGSNGGASANASQGAIYIEEYPY